MIRTILPRNRLLTLDITTLSLTRNRCKEVNRILYISKHSPLANKEYPVWYASSHKIVCSIVCHNWDPDSHVYYTNMNACRSNLELIYCTTWRLSPFRPFFSYNFHSMDCLSNFGRWCFPLQLNKKNNTSKDTWIYLSHLHVLDVLDLTLIVNNLTENEWLRMRFCFTNFNIT